MGYAFPPENRRRDRLHPGPLRLGAPPLRRKPDDAVPDLRSRAGIDRPSERRGRKLRARTYPHDREPAAHRWGLNRRKAVPRRRPAHVRGAPAEDGGSEER